MQGDSEGWRAPVGVTGIERPMRVAPPRRPAAGAPSSRRRIRLPRAPVFSPPHPAGLTPPAAPRHSTQHDISRHVLGGSLKTESASRIADPSLLILVSLRDGPKHGYAMLEDVERLAGVRLGPGTLYGAIARLEERGMIRPLAADDRRRPYEITAAGVEAVDREVEALERLARAARERIERPPAMPADHIPVLRTARSAR